MPLITEWLQANSGISEGLASAISSLGVDTLEDISLVFDTEDEAEEACQGLGAVWAAAAQAGFSLARSQERVATSWDWRLRREALW